MKVKIMLFILLIILNIIGNIKEKPVYLPVYEQILVKTGFTLSYSEEHEQAKWVAYKISKMNIQGKANRKKHNFKEDTAVITGSATLKDYKKSGYDRGHLAPAAIMIWSDVAMAESFLLSNISPQTASCNRGIWKRLENLMRKWINNNDSLFIISGPILKITLKKIGPSNVSVPEHFYKVVLKICSDETKAIGFIVPNEKAGGDLKKYAVTVDKIEEMTNINFFESMDDSLENRIEGTFDYYTW